MHDFQGQSFDERTVIRNKLIPVENNQGRIPQAMPSSIPKSNVGFLKDA
jgi:hypothetical protein